MIEVQERRVSEAMRLQYREDLWEFNPDLLKEEIERLRREPVLLPQSTPGVTAPAA